MLSSQLDEAQRERDMQRTELARLRKLLAAQGLNSNIHTGYGDYVTRDPAARGLLIPKMYGSGGPVPMYAAAAGLNRSVTSADLKGEPAYGDLEDLKLSPVMSVRPITPTSPMQTTIPTANGPLSTGRSSGRQGSARASVRAKVSSDVSMYNCSDVSMYSSRYGSWRFFILLFFFLFLYLLFSFFSTSV
jgi:hypothetical protein